VAGDSANAAALFTAAVGLRTTFWTDAEALLRLCQPIVDAIEQIQGDAPMLSQMRPMWVKLTDHAAAWMAADSTPAAAKVEDVAVVLTRRMGKLWHPAMGAAFVLDPIFFSLSEDTGIYRPDFSELGAVRRVCKRACACLGVRQCRAGVRLCRAGVQLCYLLSGMWLCRAGVRLCRAGVWLSCMPLMRTAQAYGKWCL
jgi:hypothetical protein